MVRQSRARNIELLLDAPDRQALRPGPHQHSVDLQAGRIAQSFELGCCYFQFHRNKVCGHYGRVKGLSMEIEIAERAELVDDLQQMVSRDAVALRALSRRTPGPAAAPDRATRHWSVPEGRWSGLP